jgi:hypothetical protein
LVLFGVVAKLFIYNRPAAAKRPPAMAPMTGRAVGLDAAPEEPAEAVALLRTPEALERRELCASLTLLWAEERASLRLDAAPPVAVDRAEVMDPISEEAAPSIELNAELNRD